MFVTEAVPGLLAGPTADPHRAAEVPAIHCLPAYPTVTVEY